MPPVTPPIPEQPKLNLSPQVEERLVFDKGLYPGELLSFIVVKQTSDPSKSRAQLNCIATRPSDGQHKRTFPSAIDCSLEAFSGSKVPQWLRNLGFDPADPDIANKVNSVAPIKCQLQLDVETRQDRAGHPVKDNVVTEILGA